MQRKHYDTTLWQREGVLKALKKKTGAGYSGIHFILESNVDVSRTAERRRHRLTGAPLTRSIGWIQPFYLEMRHMSGKKHTAAGRLSRRSAAERRKRSRS